MIADKDGLLSSYPRTRPALPPRHARIYWEEYKTNRGVHGGMIYKATAGLESWMHRRIAGPARGDRILELGGGTLNHLPYESAHSVYDVVEPYCQMYEESPHRNRVGRFYRDISEVPADSTYDRILSVAVLEHLEDLPAVLAAAALLLGQGGVFQAGIPAEGGLAWGLAWRLSTGIAYRLRTGLSYGPLMRHEHINSAEEIVGLASLLYESVSVDWFPLPSVQMAFYGYLECRLPYRHRCEAVLANTQVDDARS